MVAAKYFSHRLSGENKKFAAKNCKSYHNSPLKTVNLTKIQRFHRIHSKKKRALCGEFFFSSLLTAIFSLFSTKPRLRILISFCFFPNNHQGATLTCWFHRLQRAAQVQANIHKHQSDHLRRHKIFKYSYSPEPDDKMSTFLESTEILR